MRLIVEESSPGPSLPGEVRLFNAALAPWRREPTVREFVHRTRKELGVAARTARSHSDPRGVGRHAWSAPGVPIPWRSDGHLHIGRFGVRVYWNQTEGWGRSFLASSDPAVGVP